MGDEVGDIMLMAGGGICRVFLRTLRFEAFLHSKREENVVGAMSSIALQPLLDEYEE